MCDVVALPADRQRVCSSSYGSGHEQKKGVTLDEDIDEWEIISNERCSSSSLSTVLEQDLTNIDTEKADIFDDDDAHSTASSEDIEYMERVNESIERIEWDRSRIMVNVNAVNTEDGRIRVSMDSRSPVLEGRESRDSHTRDSNDSEVFCEDSPSDKCGEESVCNLLEEKESVTDDFSLVPEEIDMNAVENSGSACKMKESTACLQDSLSKVTEEDDDIDYNINKFLESYELQQQQNCVSVGGIMKNSGEDNSIDNLWLVVEDYCMYFFDSTKQLTNMITNHCSEQMTTLPSTLSTTCKKLFQNIVHCTYRLKKKLDLTDTSLVIAGVAGAVVGALMATSALNHRRMSLKLQQRDNDIANLMLQVMDLQELLTRNRRKYYHHHHHHHFDHFPSTNRRSF